MFVLGEHVQSRSGLGAGALSTWGLLFWFFTAWKLLVWKFLLLFLSPRILTGVRGCLQPVLSTHISHTSKRKAGLGVLWQCLSPAPGGSCSAAPRGVHPALEIVPKTGLRVRLHGDGASLDRSVHGRVPAVVCKEGLEGLRPCSRAVTGLSQRLAVAMPMGGRACALQELLSTPTAIQRLWKSISSAGPCFPDCVCYCWAGAQ